MARLRTIKPAFFLNEELAAVPMAGRLLFAGLWCIADRRGRLEDRPVRIKAEILPYDDCDVDVLLQELHGRGFIQRYEVGGKRYIQVVAFGKHQHPHVNEAESTIPAPESHGASTVLLGWEPDYGNRTMGTGNLEPEGGAADAAAPAPDDRSSTDYSRQVFEDYRLRIQPKAKFLDDARRKIETRLRRWTPEELSQAIAHFAADPWQMEHNSHRGATWFFATDSRIEQYVNLAPKEAKHGAADRPARRPDSGLAKYAAGPRPQPG